MVPKSTSGGSIRARQVPQAIRFLRKLGVPATRLAGILGDTADNIRHIDNRAYSDTPVAAEDTSFPKDDLAFLRLSSEAREAQFRRNIQGIRLRSKQDLDQVEATVWTVFNSHQSVGLEEGYETLLAMLPSVANARHGDALKIRQLIEEKLAWFALPLNWIETALGHAQHAMNLGVEAFRESAGAKNYLLRYSEAALIASICVQKLHQPGRAFALIQLADEANIAAGQLPGSEHLRQRGASFIHLGRKYDYLADKVLSQAPARMHRQGEARHDVDLAMNGLRQKAFLDPAWGWDKSLELADEVKKVYGNSSMQYEVAAKSAALAGLKFATTESISESLKLLKEISPESAASDVPNILSITPQLKLSPENLDQWLRFAMNETPLRPRK
jgi:hypothetical protein